MSNIPDFSGLVSGFSGLVGDIAGAAGGLVGSAGGLGGIAQFINAVQGPGTINVGPGGGSSMPGNAVIPQVSPAFFDMPGFDFQPLLGPQGSSGIPQIVRTPSGRLPRLHQWMERTRSGQSVVRTMVLAPQARYKASVSGPRKRCSRGGR